MAETVMKKFVIILSSSIPRANRESTVLKMDVVDNNRKTRPCHSVIPSIRSEEILKKAVRKSGGISFFRTESSGPQGFILAITY